MAYSLNRCFNNNIFHLIVGSARQDFYVHQQILAKSPVLACMTTGPFSESRTKEILLPEDDAYYFGRVIGYLYGDSVAPFDFGSFKDWKLIEKFVELYIMVDKYKVYKMKGAIIKKLEKLEVLQNDANVFFHMAFVICQRIKNSDEVFDSFFAEEAVEYLESDLLLDSKKLSAYIRAGGKFADMVLQSYMLVHKEEKSSLKEAERKLLRARRSDHAKCRSCCRVYEEESD